MADLIAYFSRKDENYVSGTLKYLEVGNTEIVADMLQKLTGSDLFYIEMKEPYAEKYNDCIEQAQDDQKKNARPELKKYLNDLDRYDTIYLGYPNYWGTMPMAVFTFLEHYDLKGKTIKPFCTNEGSGLGRSMEDLKKECPDSLIKPGLALNGSQVKNSEAELQKWVKE